MAHENTGHKKILFFTNSDYGQANVILATVQSLRQVAPNTDIHIASFRPLEAAVQDAARQPQNVHTSPAVEDPDTQQNGHNEQQQITFHVIEGLSQYEAAARPEVGVPEAYDLKPGFANTARNILIIPGIMVPWRPDEFVEIYRASERILKQVQPDITVVEPLFTPALTLCHQERVNWIVLAPNTIKDFALPLQPGLAMLWKYPIVCSALSFPVPTLQIPYNVALNLVAGYMLLTDTRLKKTSEYIRKHISKDINLMTANELGVLKAAPPGLRILVANSPDLDYPFDILPKHVITCGPIIRAAPAISTIDRELQQWLARAPTVYVNLGTHLKATANEAVEMARAFRKLLDHADSTDYSDRHGGRKLQVLWKLQRKIATDDTQSTTKPSDPTQYIGPWKEIHDILGPEIDADRVRITNWVTAEPCSVLATGHIVCSVNHGGASSFNEAICNGVPQVLLPAWSDCYDFGNRVELLGVGKWANQKAKPRWQREELGAALLEVVVGPRAKEILKRSKELAVCHPEWEGREKAAREIIAAMQQKESE